MYGLDRLMPKFVLLSHWPRLKPHDCSIDINFSILAISWIYWYDFWDCKLLASSFKLPTSTTKMQVVLLDLPHAPKKIKIKLHNSDRVTSYLPTHLHHISWVGRSSSIRYDSEIIEQMQSYVSQNHLGNYHMSWSFFSLIGMQFCSEMKNSFGCICLLESVVALIMIWYKVVVK